MCLKCQLAMGNEATMSAVVQCQGMILRFHGIHVEAHTITSTQNSLAIITAHSTETTLMDVA